MKENKKKSFDFAAETTKQLITISTAIITLTVTFSKDILGNSEDTSKCFLILTWGVFIVSIILGVVTLMALTGTLDPMNSNHILNDSSLSDTEKEEKIINQISINNRNIRILSICQAVLFCVAIVLTGIFGYNSLTVKKSNKKHKNEYQIIRHSTLNNDTIYKYTDTLYLPIEK